MRTRLTKVTGGPPDPSAEADSEAQDEPHGYEAVPLRDVVDCRESRALLDGYDVRARVPELVERLNVLPVPVAVVVERAAGAGDLLPLEERLLCGDRVDGVETSPDLAVGPDQRELRLTERRRREGLRRRW
jgi:hypothetical protein